MKRLNKLQAHLWIFFCLLFAASFFTLPQTASAAAGHRVLLQEGEASYTFLTNNSTLVQLTNFPLGGSYVYDKKGQVLYIIHPALQNQPVALAISKINFPALRIEQASSTPKSANQPATWHIFNNRTLCSKVEGNPAMARQVGLNAADLININAALTHLFFPYAAPNPCTQAYLNPVLGERVGLPMTSLSKEGEGRISKIEQMNPPDTHNKNSKNDTALHTPPLKKPAFKAITPSQRVQLLTFVAPPEVQALLAAAPPQNLSDEAAYRNVVALLKTYYAQRLHE